jgi:predicted ester cyclase
MLAEQNKAFIRQYFDALSGKAKPVSVVDQYVADQDVTLKQHIMEAERGFPQYELLAEDMVAEGEKVMVRARLRATHAGEFMGIPATGRQIDVEVALIYTLMNGKIVDHWMLVDSLSLMQQLGVLPMPHPPNNKRALPIQLDSARRPESGGITRLLRIMSNIGRRKALIYASK